MDYQEVTTMASNYIYSTRDLKFIIKEWLDCERIFSFSKYRDFYSIDDVDTILDQFNKIALDKVAPSNDDGEKIQVQFKDGKVTIPPSFHEIYKYLHNQGWGISNLDEDMQGTLPQILYATVTEMISAANPAFIPYINLSGGVAELITSFASDWDKKTYLPPLYRGEWTGTMCLTEAGGGTDVGDILTKAYASDKPGVYKIKGSKIFITAGDHDMSDNIVHMLLAKIEGAAAGTKGISLFIVPKIWVNEDGSLGEDNDVSTVGIEYKMGLKGSSTVSLNFGENDCCQGILIGEPPDANGIAQGIAQMFKMMNGARMDTGQTAYTLASQAYFNASEYARSRIQGRPYDNPKGERVSIINHADIRRKLLNMKAVTEAMRAMAFKTYYYMDISRHSNDEKERQMAKDRIEIATPLVKAYCSDMAWQLIADAIQVYGGYGYSEEYPVAQLARDCKIYSIWEGTNYIQSMDLVGRKWSINGGEVFRAWFEEIASTLDSFTEKTEFVGEVKLMKKTLESYNNIRYLIKEGVEEGRTMIMPLYATRILHATSQIYCGTLILEQAFIANNKMQELSSEHWDYSFYQGKVEAARYYINNVVPAVFTLETIIKTNDYSAIDVDEKSLGV